MKIQIIDCEVTHNDEQGIVYSNFNHPCSLDEFDFNIINLNTSKLWSYVDNSKESINDINDLLHIGQMIEKSDKTVCIFAFPRNLSFKYDQFQGKYYKQVEIKNNLPNVEDIISKITHIVNKTSLIFEPTKTNIFDEEMDADFYFQIARECREDVVVKTKSFKSEKTTTVKIGRVYLTTLDICNGNIGCFLRAIGLYTPKEPLPQWLIDFSFFNDSEQKAIIAKNNEIMKKAMGEIEQSQTILEKNNYYKSILMSNGDQLVATVFEILENLLGCDLSNFMDEKKEDFDIFFDGITFIGEIKGENKGVRNSHISQLRTHVEVYNEENPHSDSTKTKGVLIMNHQRSTPLPEREKVHQLQIDTAKRDGVLIIETTELLKIFERFLKRQVTSEQCIKAFSEKTGLFIADEA